MSDGGSSKEVARILVEVADDLLEVVNQDLECQASSSKSGFGQRLP